MPYIKSEAIILAKKTFGDADKQLVLVTDSDTVIEAKIRKAKDTKTRWACVTEPISIVDCELYERSQRFTITSLSLQKYYSSFGTSFEKSAVSEFISEAVCFFVPQDMEESGIYELLLNSFECLDASKNPFYSMGLFLSGFFALLGYPIDTQYCSLCSGSIDEGAFFDYGSTSFLCDVCAKPGMPSVPGFAIEALRRMQYADWKNWEMDEKLVKGVCTLLARALERKFEKNLHSTLHVIGL
ncbi:MAG TPA: DNA repair protein RecO [Caldisericia bacterium]|nr:MAG: DNA repair protein RecO [bacterium ADurb.Bin132]HNY60658.1 DNA repair protein RecO [Caldisericia bacterium]HOC79698.1 DNA repair protein RecO [Caldisericia bacterium]HOG70016.1 DNA repair protein RecO [Caldisericia bacterium]HPA64984.1 DNA repair protein RecO [Caldisericia bacterium]